MPDSSGGTPTDCACGRRHASWWRTAQAPSCGIPRAVVHEGVVYSRTQWAQLQTLTTAAGLEPARN